MLPVAVARSFSDNNAICYALPVGFVDDVMSSDNEAYAKFVLEQAQFREIKKRMGESCYPRLPC